MAVDPNNNLWAVDRCETDECVPVIELGPDGKSRQSERGEALRHPFTGVALALECGVPDEVCHVIAAHAAEGDLVKRTTEAYIVHHADFMAFLPFKNPKNVKVK